MKPVVISFMFQEMKNVEILKREGVGGRKMSTPSPRYSLPNPCNLCHLIQNGMIGSNKVKDLGRRSLFWIIRQVLKAITGILMRGMHRRSDRHTQRKEENLKAKAEAGVIWPQVKGRRVASRS